MAVQPVTEALMTEAMGQQIVEAIQDLAASQSPEAKNVSQTAIPGVSNVNAALEYLKDEVESSQGGDVKTVNNIEPDENGDVHIDEVRFAKQLVTEDAQPSSGTFIERTTGGSASLSDGDAQLIAIFGRSVKTGYVPEALNIAIDAIERQVPEGITATLNGETFIAYITPEESGEEESEEETPVSLAGTYGTEFDGTDWSIDPEDLGLTISGTPAAGDSITILYDGENDPSITQVSCPRSAPPEITATIDRDTFVAAVSSSGTITLTYDSGWSTAPSTYGVTVTNTPVDGDTITISYTKEDRGVISHATPTAFKSTGWNLYNNTNGYARVLKYSELYGFIIGGTYTAVQFSETLTGEKTTITPVDGHFNISSDGYVWVTGGNSTDTYIVMEWSDWTDGPEGDFAAYTESVVDLSSVMSNFPYGLMQVGSVYDEIDINMGYAYSRVSRLTYSDANLAYAKALGQVYDVDRNYIYVPKETVDVYEITIDGSHTACDHGMEFLTGTTVAVFVQTLYGNNLVDKLRRDVLTLSQQTLTESEKNQVCQNLGINRGTLRKVQFAIGVGDWVAITGGFKATFLSSYITSTCDWTVVYDRSYRNTKRDFMVDLKTGGGGLEFITSKKPSDTVTGIIKVFDNDDGKLPVVFQQTVGSIENGYTGQNSMAGIRNSFGIGDLATLKTSAKTNLVAAVNEQYDHIANLLPSKVASVPASGSKDFTLSAGTRCFIFGCNNVGAYFMILAFCDGSGNTNSIPIITASNVTVTSSTTYKLTVATSLARNIECGILIMAGDVTV